jgi:hypothetical protein
MRAAASPYLIDLSDDDPEYLQASATVRVTISGGWCSPGSYCTPPKLEQRRDRRPARQAAASGRPPVSPA